MRAPASLAWITLSLAITGCAAVTSTNDAKAPAQVKSGFMGLSRADDITVDSPAPFKGVQRVVIGSFKVGFVESKVARQRAGGGLFSSGFGGKASAGLTLTGVPIETMQAITDQAYADFVSRLTAAGYDVVSRDVLLNSDEFKKASSDVSPLRESASFFGSSTGMTYVAPRDLGRIYWFMGEAGKTGGFGFSNTTVAAQEFARKTGIRVLSVLQTVDFANSDGYGGSFASSASVQVGQSLTLAPGGGIILAGNTGSNYGAQSGSVKLGQPVSSSETFAEVIGTTSDAEKGLETGVNVITAIAGMGTNQRRDFEVRADASKYGTLASGVIAGATDQLVERMASLR